MLTGSVADNANVGQQGPDKKGSASKTLYYKKSKRKRKKSKTNKKNIKKTTKKH